MTTKPIDHSEKKLAKMKRINYKRFCFLLIFLTGTVFTIMANVKPARIFQFEHGSTKGNRKYHMGLGR